MISQICSILEYRLKDIATELGLSVEVSKDVCTNSVVIRFRGPRVSVEHHVYAEQLEHVEYVVDNLRRKLRHDYSAKLLELEKENKYERKCEVAPLNYGYENPGGFGYDPASSNAEQYGWSTTSTAVNEHNIATLTLTDLERAQQAILFNSPTLKLPEKISHLESLRIEIDTLLEGVLQI